VFDSLMIVTLTLSILALHCYYIFVLQDALEYKLYSVLNWICWKIPVGCIIACLFLVSSFYFLLLVLD